MAETKHSPGGPQEAGKAGATDVQSLPRNAAFQILLPSRQNLAFRPSSALSGIPGVRFLLKFHLQSPNSLADRHGNHPCPSLQASSHPGQHWLFQLGHPGLSKKLTFQDWTLSSSQPGLGGEMGLPEQSGPLNTWRHSPEKGGHVSTRSSGLGVEMQVEGAGIVDTVDARYRWCVHPQPPGMVATKGS